MILTEKLIFIKRHENKNQKVMFIFFYRNFGVIFKSNDRGGGGDDGCINMIKNLPITFSSL